MRYDQIGLNVMTRGYPAVQRDYRAGVLKASGPRQAGIGADPNFVATATARAWMEVCGPRQAGVGADPNFVATAAATAGGILVFLGLATGTVALVYLLKGGLWALGTAVALGGGFYLWRAFQDVVMY